MPLSDTSEREARLHHISLDRARAADDHVWRPMTFEGMFTQEAFNEGKVTPLGLTQIIWTSLPWFARAFSTVVPEPYIAEDLNSDGYSAATVSCPCGESHEIEIGNIFSTECGRAFAWFGKAVLVANLNKLMEEPPE